MRRPWVCAGALALLLATPVALADYVEVRRVAEIVAEPSRNAEVLDAVGPTEEEPLVILYLDPEDPREGNYLRVLVPSTGDIGYVYKTAGRVYRDHDGKYRTYDRKAYRHWVDEDRNCLDTRQEVLLRDDSSGSARVERRAGKCSVVGATWDDPYTGSVISRAKQIDIDHFVPLKNAHESGGWAWSKARKQAYANFLGNPYHVLAVSGSENRSKGQRGPDEYLPPNAAYHCEYVTHWLEVKHEWGLRIAPAEVVAIDGVLDDCPEN